MESLKTPEIKRILVTGAMGFVGQNLIAKLKYTDGVEILPYDLDSDSQLLEHYCKICDFVYHLAGINRPPNESDFMEGNCDFTARLLQTLQKYKNDCPVMLSSSIQADMDNPYGKSKRAAECLIHEHAQKTGADAYIYRFSNLFGKWCRPNYNSVVATFCYNIARNLPIKIHDPKHILELVYIDDAADSLIGLLNLTDKGVNQKADTSVTKKEDRLCQVEPSYKISVGEIADLLTSFASMDDNKQIPDMSENSFSKKLYSTFLSYLPEDKFIHTLDMNIDERGSFTEIFRTCDRGQFSINISKPGVEKGNHWHHTKNEKFIVVSGNALIKLRKIGNETVISYHVSGKELKVVNIPVGYTHSIMNTGSTDLVTLMWCNECFNPDKPDTYYLNINDEHIVKGKVR